MPEEAKSGVVAISAGGTHALALREDGSVVTWGDNITPALKQVPAAAMSGVTAIEAGNGYSLVIKNGAVIGWGLNDKGQLDIPYEAQSGIAEVAAGAEAVIARTDSGRVFGWAQNRYGELDVPAGAQCGVSSISIGYHACLALV